MVTLKIELVRQNGFDFVSAENQNPLLFSIEVDAFDVEKKRVLQIWISFDNRTNTFELLSKTSQKSDVWQLRYEYSLEVFFVMSKVSKDNFDVTKSNCLKQ